MARRLAPFAQCLAVFVCAGAAERGKHDAMTELPADRCVTPRSFWRALERRGLAPAVVLRRAGLPASLPLNPDGYVTTAQLFGIWKAVEALATTAGIGIDLVENAQSGGRKPAILAASYAATYRDALHLLAGAKRYGGCFQLEFEERDGQFAIAKNWLFATEPEPAISAEMSFASLLELGRKGTDRQLRPIRMDFTHFDPGTGRHRAYFACPIRYGAPRNLLVLRSRDVDLPFAAHDPELFGILAPALSQAPGELHATNHGERVKDAIKRQLGKGPPRIAQIARDLAMSERTLQRRITAEGTTFRALLADARQEMSRHLLADPQIAVDRVARLLGYRDTSTFDRAFRAWEGMPPGAWRGRNAAARSP